jgi:hypothetical protein
MGKPVKHYGKWRIRWTDEHGKRRNQNFDAYEDALFELRQREVEVQEIKRGFRAPRVVNKTFAELCDYWITKRLPLKRYGEADALGPPLGPCSSVTWASHKLTNIRLSALTSIRKLSQTISRS